MQVSRRRLSPESSLCYPNVTRYPKPSQFLVELTFFHFEYTVFEVSFPLYLQILSFILPFFDLYEYL